MASALPPFPPFNVDDDVTTTGQRWDKWTKRFNNFFVAMNITDATRKRALLLHYIGRSAFDIFETLTDTGDAKAYDKLVNYRLKRSISSPLAYDNLPLLANLILLIKKSSPK